MIAVIPHGGGLIDVIDEVLLDSTVDCWGRDLSASVPCHRIVSCIIVIIASLCPLRTYNVIAQSLIAII